MSHSLYFILVIFFLMFAEFDRIMFLSEQWKMLQSQSDPRFRSRAMIQVHKYVFRAFSIRQSETSVH